MSRANCAAQQHSTRRKSPVGLFPPTGTDAGWHLKLPAGPDARTEVRAPLRAANGRGDGSQEDVPTELLDVVLAIVRDHPLVPVARITTRRAVHLLHSADGAVLAEFCD